MRTEVQQQTCIEVKKTINCKVKLKGRTLVILCDRRCNLHTVNHLVNGSLPLNYDKIWLHELETFKFLNDYECIVIIFERGSQSTELTKNRIKKIKSQLSAEGIVYLVVWAPNHVQQFSELLQGYGEVVERLRGNEHLKRQLRHYFKEVNVEHIEWEQQFLQAEAVIVGMIEIYSDVLLHPRFDLDDFKLFVTKYLCTQRPFVVDMHYQVFKCIHRL